jgi:hypothetical protein
MALAGRALGGRERRCRRGERRGPDRPAGRPVCGLVRLPCRVDGALRAHPLGTAPLGGDRRPRGGSGDLFGEAEFVVQTGGFRPRRLRGAPVVVAVFGDGEREPGDGDPGRVRRRRVGVGPRGARTGVTGDHGEQSEREEADAQEREPDRQSFGDSGHQECHQ